MARKTIFLETAFWDKFSECARALNPFCEGGDPVETFEKISRWNNLYKFICRSSVYSDSPLSSLAEKAKTDPMLLHLLKSTGDGKMDLTSSEEPFPDLDSSKEFECEGDHEAIYFTEKDHRPGAIKHGVINICIDTIWNHQSKFLDSGKAVQSDAGWHWRSMDILKENSNSMVIIDNFILAPDKKNGQCSINYSLRELLRLSLPDSSDEDYTLSLFYFDDSEERKVREYRKDQFFRSINDFLRRNKKCLKVTLELFPPVANGINYHKDFHDRTVITNNVWIGSEAGFDLLIPDTTLATNARAIKTTKTHGLYFGFGNEVAEWLTQSYDHLIAEAKRCIKRYGYSTQNRLLL